MKSRCLSIPLKVAVLAITVGAFLAGCGTALDPSEQIAKDRLERARIAYAQAKAKPIVESYSMKTLLEAEEILQEAERVRTIAYSPNPRDPSKQYSPREKKLFFDDISRLAYMAERKSDTAIALADGIVANNEVVNLGREMAEVQLQKSQMEQKLLQQDLVEKASALNLARQKLSTAESEAERAKILADIHAKEAELANAQAKAKALAAEKALAEAEAQAIAAEKAKAEAEAQAIAAEKAKAEAEAQAVAAEKARAEAKAIAAEKAKIEAEAQAIAAEKARAEAEAQAIAAEKARAEAEARAQAIAAEKARAEAEALMKEISELQGQLTDRGIVLTIGDVLFAFDKSDLTASAQISIDKIAKFLREHPNRNLLVEGHTDSIGTDEYNQGLSERRAASVSGALEKRDVASERIFTIGYGEKYPVASNDTVIGRQQNRRVDVIILNEGVKPESQIRK
ncbi:MAG: OmpA family protein [Deltaproteobacteria bacterium]|nr:OmpA family protein [Deltaproteobacteria bacterium]